MNLSKVILILLIFFISCQPKPKKEITTASAETVGLQFINDYINNIGGLGMVEWIEKNPVTTKNFKTTLKKMVDDAEKEAPGYGLGFDPILDAQDYPDKGFDLKSIDTVSGYLTVFGKEWKDFELTIKLIKKSNKWMVEGAGLINIPEEKQASRD